MVECNKKQTFEDIRHIDENGVEFWYARELMPILEYSNWQNFEKIVKKAKISCENSDIKSSTECETSRDCSLSKQKIRKKRLKEGSGEEDSYKNPEIMLQKYS